MNGFVRLLNNSVYHSMIDVFQNEEIGKVRNKLVNVFDSNCVQ